jgi:hypothetical protein
MPVTLRDGMAKRATGFIPVVFPRLRHPRFGIATMAIHRAELDHTAHLPRGPIRARPIAYTWTRALSTGTPEGGSGR